MTLIAKIRERSISQGIEERRKFYALPRTVKESLDEQLRLWNQEWSRLVEHSPYYRRLQCELGLPRQFHSWEEFAQCVPKLRARTCNDTRRRSLATNGRRSFSGRPAVLPHSPCRFPLGSPN